MKKFIVFATLFIAINCLFQNLAMGSLAKSTNYNALITSQAVFKSGSIYIYSPFKFLALYGEFGKRFPNFFRFGAFLSFIGFAISLLTPAIFYLQCYKKKLDSAGSARWANKKELERAKVLVAPGFIGNAVIVGCWDTGMDYEKVFAFCRKTATAFVKLRNLGKKIDWVKVSKELENPYNAELKQTTEIFNSTWSWLRLFSPFTKRQYLIDDEPSHLFMGAPSRTGKGIGVVVPTLLTWTGSSVVADPKRENLELTGGYRQHVFGHNVLEFALADRRKTARFNPANEVRWGTPYEGHDVDNLIGILVGEGSGSDKHWIENAKSLIIGTLTHLKYSHARLNFLNGQIPGDEDYIETSFYHVYEFLSTAGSGEDPSILGKVTDELKKAGDSDSPLFAPHFSDMAHLFVYNKRSDLPKLEFIITEAKAADIFNFSHEAKQTPWLHPVVAEKLGGFAGKAPNEASGVVSTAVTALQMFSEKIVIENTCTSDFLLADLMQSEKPTDLFLVVPPSDLARAGNLFRLIIELLVIRNTEVLGQNKHKCLLLIDEFPAFGKMDSLVRQLGYIAGYGFKALLIFQGLEQIKNIYKNNFEMLVNTTTQVFFAPNDDATRDYLSKLLGKETILVKQESGSGGLFAKKNYTWIEKERALLMPDETAAKLGNHSAMILKNLRIFSPKNKFFMMEDFMKRIIQGKKASRGRVGLRKEE